MLVVPDDAVPVDQRLVVGVLESVWLADVPHVPFVAVTVEAQVVPFQEDPVAHVACIVLVSRVSVPDTRVKVLAPCVSTRGVDDPVREEENCVVPWRTERVVTLDELQDIGTVQLEELRGIVHEVGSEIKDADGVATTGTVVSRRSKIPDRGAMVREVTG